MFAFLIAETGYVIKNKGGFILTSSFRGIQSIVEPGAAVTCPVHILVNQDALLGT